jgi:predicted esterase
VKTHNIIINRTARYFSFGEVNDSLQEIWIVLHGYGQLASEFLANFEILDNGSRLIVAPEGLSRFYIKNSIGEIGASWMTSEDRLNEISDYINYLSQIDEEIRKDTKGKRIKTVLLGFSQGTATATRWFEKSNSPIAELILWGGHISPDSNLSSSRYKETQLSLVYGAQDRFMLPTYFEEDISILKKYDVGYRVFSYNGGHTIDADTLLKLT